jgi:hypothetical protein
VVSQRETGNATAADTSREDSACSFATAGTSQTSRFGVLTLMGIVLGGLQVRTSRQKADGHDS